MMKVLLLSLVLTTNAWASDHHAPAAESHSAHESHPAPEAHPAKESKEHKESSWKKVPKAVWHGVFGKLEELQHADQRAASLELEVSQLKVKLTEREFECRTESATKRAQALTVRLNKETGDKTGRTVATVDFTIPSNWSPEQIHVLALSYFAGGEFEKAAVLMKHLMELPDVDSIKTPRNYLVTAISMYHIDNFNSADQFFDEVLRIKESQDQLKYAAQARLWKALVASRLNKKLKEQYWLRELLDYHPQSKEARWINGGGPERVPSSHSEENAHE